MSFDVPAQAKGLDPGHLSFEPISFPGPLTRQTAIVAETMPRAFAAAATSRRSYRDPARAQPFGLAKSQHAPNSQQPKRPYHGAAEPAKDAVAKHPPNDGAARLDITQLIQKLQRDVNVQKKVYQNVETYFARILRGYESDK
ncbi:hypothetical protein PspLS_12052 [Pyricularia sp. CBS 133598]|nr:hypothetical protein PspLS_12052 [Pyricularia sp. CBS 133598]